MNRTLSSFLLIFCLGLLFQTCNNNSDNEPQPSFDILESLRALEAINDLVTDARQETINGQVVWIITFEEADSLVIEGSDLDSVLIDRDNWEATFFAPGGEQEAIDFLGSSLNIPNSAIQLNPSGFAPLAAQVNMQTPVQGKIAVQVLGKGPDGVSLGKQFSRFDDNHQFPILGLYPDHLNEVKVTFTNSMGKVRVSETLQIQTDTISLPDLNIIQNNLPTSDSALYWVANLNMGFDRQGEVRWAWTNPDAYHMYGRTKNGNFLINTQENRIRYYSSGFFEVDPLGNIVQFYTVPEYMHHELFELPNGNFLVGANTAQPIGTDDGQLQDDKLFEMERGTGNIVKEWDMNLILDNQRRRLPGERGDDWLHLNAVYLDEADNSLIISGRGQCAVYKIDYDTGDLKWILSPPEFWNDSLSPFLLQPDYANSIDTVDFWPYGQHTPVRMENGNILMYDNGRYRNFYSDSTVSVASYSRAAEYKIDEVNKTVSLVWVFDENKQYFTTAAGSTTLNPENQNKLLGFLWSGNGGNTPRLYELDAQNQVIFEAVVNPNNNYYRFFKFQIYQGVDNGL